MILNSVFLAINMNYNQYQSYDGAMFHPLPDIVSSVKVYNDLTAANIVQNN